MKKIKLHLTQVFLGISIFGLLLVFSVPFFFQKDTQAVSAATVTSPIATYLGKYVGPLKPDETISSNGSDADYSGLVYSSYYGKAYLFGGGHAATYRDNVASFNPANLSWGWDFNYTSCADINFANLDKINGRWISSNNPVARHTYDLMVPVGDRILMAAQIQGRGRGCHNLPPVNSTSSPYVIASAKFAWYKPSDGTWTYTNTPSVSDISAMELDPVSGKILVVNRAAINLYDPVADTFTKVKSLSSAYIGMTWSANLVYAPVTDKFYYLGQAPKTGYNRSVYEVTLDRTTPANSTVVELPVIIPSLARQGWDYDPIHKTIAGGIASGVIYTFDPVLRTVAQTTMPTVTGAPLIGNIHGYAFTWVPAINGFVFRGWNGGGSFHTWMYQVGDTASSTPQ